MVQKQNSDNSISGKPLRRLGYQIANLQGVGQRARQEDSFSLANAFDVKSIINKGLLFIVCDGMGGMKDGKEASEAAIASIRQSYANLNRQEDISVQLKNALYIASDSVYSLVAGEGGSTAIVSLILDEKLYYSSVGDSFLYLKRGDSLVRINREHNMCNQIFMECIKDNCMDPTEGRNDAEAVALTQFIGKEDLNDVDGFVKPLPLREGDVILSCSDGVGGTLSESEILSALSCETSQEMCDQLDRLIISHAKVNQDNYTAIVVKCVK